ncbi:MAG: FHA domain-containing protein [Spirulina sp. SIO3F2]|nr:FHA domain-containing protein [Spirulina sp. SIO3F2]
MSYFLVCYPDSDHEKIYPLQWGSNLIGRSPSNHITIKHSSLSRRHAEIQLQNESWFIRDLHSLNGTFVNQVKVEHQFLQNGDIIVCGMVQFRFIGIVAERDEDTFTGNLPIVRQYSPRQSRVAIEDIIDKGNKSKNSGSALRLSQQDVNQRTVDKLNLLLEVGKQLSAPEEPQKLLDRILELLLEIMEVDRAAILLVNEQTQKLEQKAVRTRSGISVRYQFYSTKITNYVYRHGDAVLTDDAGEDQRFEGSDSILIQAIRASICAPLQPGDNVIGVLYVDNLTCSNAYSTEDLEFVSALANQAAIAIANARLTEKMRTEAVWRDKLERFFPASISRKLKEGGELGIIDTEITALFADISSFTEMSSTMEPREIIEMLNDYFNVMVEEIVFAYEGTLEKYIGDALLAIWGAPYAREDDTDRAVQAAIDMQYAVKRLNQDWQAQNRRPIAIHIGLNSGKVAAGNIGSSKLIQYAAIGDTTNVTSRICGVAQAGEILLSEETLLRLAHPDIPLTALPPVQVKGKREPLVLYRLDWQQIQRPALVT